MHLTDAQMALADAAQQCAQKLIAPHAATWERDGTGTPTSVLESLGQQGYFGLLVPQEYGGSAVDMVSYALITEAFAAADCGLCNLVNVSNSPVAAAIRDHGNAAQCARWLSAMAAGKVHACFMLTEADAGSDAGALSTRATRDGDDWLLSGTKRFVTAGQSAQLALVIAVIDPAAGRRGMSAFLVPTDTSGYTVTRLEDKLGHRNCDTAEVVFDNLRIADSARLGEPGAGYRIALSYLNGGRIGVAAQAVGVAQAALQAAVSYAHERRTFGRAIIEHQAVAFRLADMATRISAARALTLQTAARADAGDDIATDAAMAKAFASEMAERVTSDALQVFGGYGYLRDYPVEKYYRDARVLSIYEGSNDIQNMVIARALTANHLARS